MHAHTDSQYESHVKNNGLLFMNNSPQEDDAQFDEVKRKNNTSYDA
jgi:hypothetical protein